MLSLPRVTLVCVDCANHDLALAALEQCTRKCTFARVLFITDRDFAIAGHRLRAHPDHRVARGVFAFVIKELHAYVDTDFALLVQWDGFVVNAAAWSDEFLAYDYIGASGSSTPTGTTSATAGSRFGASGCWKRCAIRTSRRTTWRTS